MDFVVVDVVVDDDVNVDIVVVDVAVVVVFYLTLMAGPVLTILLDIFCLFCRVKLLFQTHVYLDMHTLTVQTHNKQYSKCDATSGYKSPSSSPLFCCLRISSMSHQFLESFRGFIPPL